MLKSVQLMALGLAVAVQADNRTVLLVAEKDVIPTMESVGALPWVWGTKACIDIEKRVAASHAQDKQYRDLPKLLTGAGFSVTSKAGGSSSATIRFHNECQIQSLPWGTNADQVTRWEVSVDGREGIKEFSVWGHTQLGLGSNESQRTAEAEAAAKKYIEREEQAVAQLLDYLRSSVGQK